MPKKLIDGIISLKESYNDKDMIYPVWDHYYNLYIQVFTVLSDIERNTLRDFLLSVKVIIPNQETEEEYQDHLKDLKTYNLDSFDKNGYLIK